MWSYNSDSDSLWQCDSDVMLTLTIDPKEKKKKK